MNQNNACMLDTTLRVVPLDEDTETDRSDTKL